MTIYLPQNPQVFFSEDTLLQYHSNLSLWCFVLLDVFYIVLALMPELIENIVIGF